MFDKKMSETEVKLLVEIELLKRKAEEHEKAIIALINIDREQQNAINQAGVVINRLMDLLGIPKVGESNQMASATPPPDKKSYN